MFKGKRVRYAFTGTMALVLLFGILAINPTTVRASGYQVCSTVGDEYCMNRDGGGTSNGTSIIVYDKTTRTTISYFPASELLRKWLRCR
jgi:hypothetical protein